MAETAPHTIIIAGPNGAGKTTLAPFLLRDRLGLLEYVNADPIALGLSAFDPSSVAIAAGKVMLKRLHDLANQRRTFAFETTLSAKSYAPWLRRLRNSGYKIQLSFVWLRSPDLAVHRVRERVRAGGHDVPQEIIRRRYYKGLANFWGAYAPLAHAWSVYDNSGTSEPVVIGSGGTGRAVKIVEPASWQKFLETQDEERTEGHPD
jgi:predicted ABC-type ATPase